MVYGEYGLRDTGRTPQSHRPVYIDDASNSTSRRTLRVTWMRYPGCVIMINNPQFRKKIKETVSVRMAAAVKSIRIPA
jgi:hypothetical protein